MQNIQTHTGTKSILNYFFKKAKVLNYLLLFPPKTQATLPFSQNKPETVKKYNFSTTFYCTNKNAQVMVEVYKNHKSYKMMS